MAESRAKQKLFQLIDNMNGEDTLPMQYGGGLDDAYMDMSRRKSIAFADPNANTAFASPMSQGGLPTIYRQDGGDMDFMSDITQDAIDEAMVGDFADVGGSYQDQWEEAMSRESAPIQSRSTRTPGLSELGYSADEIADIRAVQADELRGDRDREDTGPSTWDEVKSWWRGDDLNINNLARNQMLGRVGLKSWKGEEPPWDSDYKMQDALPIPQRSVGGYPYWDYITPSGGFATATEASDLAQLAAEAKAADRNTSRFTSPKTWMPDVNIGMGKEYGSSGIDRPPSPTESMPDVNIGMGPKYGSSGVYRSSSPSESMPDVNIGMGKEYGSSGVNRSSYPNVNIGAGKDFGSSGEDRPIDSDSPSDYVTDERYKELYDSKGPSFTEGGQFIYNRLGRPDSGPNLDPVAIKKRLNEKGYEKFEYVYLNDLLSKGYSMEDAENMVVAGMATPGGLAAMRSGFKDGYERGGPAGHLLNALEAGVQHNIGLSGLLKQKKEDNLLRDQAQGIVATESTAEKLGIGNLFGFLGGKTKDGTLLGKEDLETIRENAAKEGYIYTPPSKVDDFIARMLGTSIPFQVLQAIIPSKSIGTITTQDGITFSLNDDGSLSLVEDPANLNYDEGPDAVPVKRRRPIQQKGPSVPTVEPEKTGMAALLAKRRKPTDRLELADDVSGQAKFRNIYGRNYRTV